MRASLRWPAVVGAGAMLGSSLILAVPAVADPGSVEDPQSGQIVGVEDTPNNIVKDVEDALQGSADDVAVPGNDVAVPGGSALLADDFVGNLTIFGTTDVHGSVFNWDYFSDSVPAKDADQRGLSRVASAISEARAAVGAESVLVLDNGDAMQGTPLTYLAAEHPERLASTIHPMAEAFNTIRYDAQNLGNHEFNYGLDTLSRYKSELNAPLLGANVNTLTGSLSFQPYEIIEKVVGGETVKIGVMGLVTPGVRVWDKAHVEGVLEFEDLVLAAQRTVPLMEADGADVIVALVHSGQNAPGVAWDPTQLQENVATSVSTLVKGLDVVIAGHSHVNIPSEVFKDPDGSPVLYTQPYFWARSASQITLPIASDGVGGFKVAWPATDAEIQALAVPKWLFAKGTVGGVGIVGVSDPLAGRM